MSGEIRRENFAVEASWIEFQRNQAELTKHQRQREAAQKHAATGRDYSVIKRINQRIKARARSKRWYSRNLEHARELNRAKAIAFYWRNPEKCRARSREWARANYEWRKQTHNWWRQRNVERERAKKRERYATDMAYREYILAWQRSPKARTQVNNRRRERYKSDPVYREKVLAKNREKAAIRRARKRAEKLAQQQQAS